ncbi:adenine phosphoribosyltransferase [Alicyclobacillus sp. ALC3]|uniref:adenine phosphoribosyltransferase n=1 Tax=Alicyclobacillus sp. ALC3 TaxID=2796143 RepID=UPI002378DFDD|nr:adenine phosphoribosyltransferase [Alicyclobacillus sp. ALC3]WDL96192.1 adenine phosphoribosyltransferase [Alicyclobacillus sp. ALC3]
MNFESYIRDVPDFPQPGVLFKDITPLLANGVAYKAAIEELAEFARDCDAQVIVGPEARGYVVGAPLAHATECGFVPVRKRGKLPWQTIGVDYALEYGTDRLEVHRDAVLPGQRVLLADDLLATGGTMEACATLVRELGGIVVGAAFLIELSHLGGRARLQNTRIKTLVQF